MFTGAGVARHQIRKSQVGAIHGTWPVVRICGANGVFRAVGPSRLSHQIRPIGPKRRLSLARRMFANSAISASELRGHYAPAVGGHAAIGHRQCRARERKGRHGDEQESQA